MQVSTNYSLSGLLDDLPQVGSIQWIGVRPGRNEPMIPIDSVHACSSNGLIGDRYSGSSGKRHVTLIQAEHLPVIASFLGVKKVMPDQLRRNLVVSGINLLALKNQRFTIGSTVLEYTGQCHPCSAMQKEFGPGGYNAIRGHGGITARIEIAGYISVGDKLTVEDAKNKR